VEETTAIAMETGRTVEKNFMLRMIFASVKGFQDVEGLYTFYTWALE